MIKTLLLDNPHRTTVSVHPDPQFCEKIDETLAQEAQQAADALSPAERKTLTADRKKSDAETELTPDADSGMQNLIPHISKEELPPVEPPIPEYIEYAGKVPVIAHEQPTNGITYLDLAIPADSLSAEDYTYLTLYTAALSSMGTKTQTWDSVAAEFAYLTGGFSAVTFSAGKHRTAEAPVFFDNALRAEDVVDRDWILIRAKMLPEYIEPAVNRIFSYLNGISFADEKRLKDIFIQLKNDLDPLPSYSGHTLASLYAASAYSGSKRAENLWTGVPQLRFLRGKYTALEQKPAAIGGLVRKLEVIHGKLMRSGLIVKVCGTAADVSSIKKALFPHLQQFGFPHRSTGGFRAEPFERPAALSAFPSAVQVGFAAQLVPAVFDENEYGASIVYAQWLETGALWEAIRVKGGAYGVSAYPDSATALFTLTTYRDPTPLKSLAVIRDCIEKSITAPLTDSEMEALITGTYSIALQPRTPAQRSSAAFSRLLNGITHQTRMRIIEGIIACTKERMNRFAERLVASVSGSTAAVICSETALRQTVDTLGLPPITVLPSI